MCLVNEIKCPTFLKILGNKDMDRIRGGHFSDSFWTYILMIVNFPLDYGNLEHFICFRIAELSLDEHKLENILLVEDVDEDNL